VRNPKERVWILPLPSTDFVIVTIELKNQGTSGTIQDAIEQYLRRNINLPIFQKPFLHIVCDNFKVKIAAAFSKPPSEKDFRDFNKDLINIPPNNREYPVHYLYQDILLPDRILNFIEKFLYVGGDNKWIFPRYHQQRVTKNITEEIKSHFLKTNQLDLKYLIQHSTGSGKSNTIVWLVQNLRTLHANAQKIFSSVVVLTDRLNLDDQISRDFQKAILSEGIASYIDSTEDLRIALETNKQVIISTIQKFTYLKDLSLKSNKRICILIDEAHRSQEGKLHESVTQTFQSDEQGIEDVPIEDVAEKVGDEIEKKRFPNLVFIALTATPSDKTLNHFGKEVRDKSTVRHEPHDVYSMKQAIEEGYILDVVKHVYTYDTLYYLNKKLESSKEYPPQLVNRGIRLKVYEDDLIIQDKCERIAKLFHIHSSSKINGKSKAMIVTSSRLAAVKYKTYLDIELKKNKYPYESLVAFTGTVSWISKDEQGNERSENYTEDGMNSTLNPRNEKNRTAI
jgi:type I restriction enzyme, R subunit